MKTNRFLLLATLLLLATANATTIAVLEITIVNDEMDLTIEETKFLSDELRRQAMRLLPKDYSVLTREKIIALAQQTTENFGTVIDIGKFLKGDYVVQGLIGKFDNLFTLTVELYETSSGNLIGDFVKESPDLKGLLDAVRENSPDLFANVKPKEEPPPPAIATPEIAKDTQAVAAVAIPTNIPPEPKKSNNSLWVAIGLDVLGATAFGLGIYNNTKSTKYHRESEKIIENVRLEQYAEKQSEFTDKYKKSQNAEKTRNIFYATGTALLLGGVAIHIWF